MLTGGLKDMRISPRFALRCAEWGLTLFCWTVSDTCPLDSCPRESIVGSAETFLSIPLYRLMGFSWWATSTGCCSFYTWSWHLHLVESCYQVMLSTSPSFFFFFFFWVFCWCKALNLVRFSKFPEVLQCLSVHQCFFLFLNSHSPPTLLELRLRRAVKVNQSSKTVY